MTDTTYSWIFSVLLSIHVMVGVGVVGLVLLQHGKGADAGAAFGGGGSAGSLFGSSGSANFFSRTTAVLATVFFLTSLGLGFIADRAGKSSGPESIMSGVEEPAAAPALDGVAPVPGAESSVPQTGEADVPVPQSAPDAPAGVSGNVDAVPK